MEVLSSRVLLRPANFERSFQFYSRTLRLYVYREWGSGPTTAVIIAIRELLHVVLFDSLTNPPSKFTVR